MAAECWDVFISYKSKDLEIAEELHRRLEAAGFDVWFDRARLEPGYKWHEEIEAGCEGSRVILPVLTPRWPGSEWCRYETYGGECIIPLLFEGDLGELLRQVPPLAEWQGVTHDLREAGEEDWEGLTAAIHERLATPAPDKAQRTAHLPFAANPYFVGREDELIEMHEKLCRAPTVALSHGPAFVLEGLGGVGKTALARQYAEKFWRLYRDILWVSAANTELLSSEFARVALELGLIEQPSDDPDADARLALAELEAGPRRLLIVDNAEDEEAVQEWLPSHGKCHTLITSRFTAWSAGMQTVCIDVLEPDPARELLLRRSGLGECEASRDAADRLAEELQYLPLALEQAAAYVCNNAISFDQYLELYRESRRELLARGVLGGTRYPDSVATTWLTTVGRLSPRALAILRLMAYMAPAPLPRWALSNCGDLLGEAAAAAGGEREELSALQLTEAVGELGAYSMVRLDTDSLDVHRLVQAVQQDNLSPEQQRDWIERALVLLVREFPKPDYSNWANWANFEALLPHGLACAEHAQTLALITREAGLLPGLVGDFLSARGQMSSARAPLEQAAEIFEQLATADPGSAEWQRALMASHQRMGDLFVAEGNLTGALAAFRELMQITEQHRPADPGNAQWQWDLSVIHGRIGAVLQAQEDLPKAMQAHEAALAILELLVEADPENAQWQRGLSVTHNNIGDVRRAQGDVKGAMAAYEAALQVCERLVAADPENVQCQWDLAVSHERIGDGRRTQGDLQGAMEAYGESFDIIESLLKADPGNARWRRHLSVSHNKIGEARREDNDLKGALEAHGAAMRIAKRLAQEDPRNAEWLRDLYVSYWWMAVVGTQMGKQNAGQWWRRAYDTLAEMEAKGIHLSTQDEGLLERLREKLAEIVVVGMEVRPTHDRDVSEGDGDE